MRNVIFIISFFSLILLNCSLTLVATGHNKLILVRVFVMYYDNNHFSPLASKTDDQPSFATACTVLSTNGRSNFKRSQTNSGSAAIARITNPEAVHVWLVIVTPGLSTPGRRTATRRSDSLSSSCRSQMPPKPLVHVIPIGLT